MEPFGLFSAACPVSRLGLVVGWSARLGEVFTDRDSYPIGKISP